MRNLPAVATREEWLVARKALLAEEKAMTRARDRLSTKRRNLPMVEVDIPYSFQGPDGQATLLDLFEGRRQLIVQHFMFDPEWDEGCSSCTAASDEVSSGLLDHLHSRDTSFAVVPRAPLEKIEQYRKLRGWSFPWYSSFGSSFNYDFHVTLAPSVAPVEFNYRLLPELVANGMESMAEGSSEQPGYSCFLQDAGRVFHTYSVFARGTESLGGACYFLDLTALGRQEEWEEPKGRANLARPAQPDFQV